MASLLSGFDEDKQRLSPHSNYGIPSSSGFGRLCFKNDCAKLHCKCDWTDTGEKQGFSQQFIDPNQQIIGPILDWVFHSFLKANASLYAG